jgi:hypothetical protein
MSKIEESDEMRSEYSVEALGNGVRGKYFNAYNLAHNVVRLDPEVAKVFKTEAEVNQALLGLIRLAQASAGVHQAVK